MIVTTLHQIYTIFSNEKRESGKKLVICGVGVWYC